ncbi:MAG TPA: hypothetical protein PLO41_14480 [Rubrivivax sp.]|nr:hypothetical protein [Rubrivivax sp.]
MAVVLVHKPVMKLQSLSDRLKAEEQRWYAALPARVVVALTLTVGALTVVLSLVNSGQQRPAVASPAAQAAADAASGNAASAAALAVRAAKEAAASAPPGTGAKTHP